MALTRRILLNYEHYGFYGSCGLGIVKKRKEKLNLKVYYRLSNLEAGRFNNFIACAISTESKIEMGLFTNSPA